MAFREGDVPPSLELKVGDLPRPEGIGFHRMRFRRWIRFDETNRIIATETSWHRGIGQRMAKTEKMYSLILLS